jgi:hypothetical protein
MRIGEYYEAPPMHTSLEEKGNGVGPDGFLVLVRVFDEKFTA